MLSKVIKIRKILSSSRFYLTQASIACNSIKKESQSKFFSVPIFLLESIFQRSFYEYINRHGKWETIGSYLTLASSPRSRPDMGRFN